MDDLLSYQIFIHVIPKYIFIQHMSVISKYIFFITASLDSPLLLEKLQLFKHGENIRKIHLLDLKHSDSRPDLVHLRNSGVQHFIVDMKAELLNIFFDQVYKDAIDVFTFCKH